MEKHCPRCDTTKPISDFPKDKSRASGVFSYCKPCNVRHVGKWQKENKERVNEASRANYAKNLDESREKRRLRVRKWYKVHAQEQRLRSNIYRKLNPEIKRLAQSRRRAMKAKNGVFEVTKSDILSLLRKPCFVCGSKENQTIDHVIPLSKGGTHSIGNFQTLCLSCNSSKHTKTMFQWKIERENHESLCQG